ncbi:PREDICTED: cornifelin homolog [Nanorana parkeri]|uniref:cornifelin homolog n=1 Tax=Nanorana parkeri TaxID=125878 RepID=UPI0008540ED7|nr:PREDICTED: cornifelin homolog [Nanorana parkeri]
MQAVTNQPGSVTTQTVIVNEGMQWSTDMCDCCDDCGICTDFGECICLPLMDPNLMGYIGCSGICPPITMAMRAAVRERYRIRGSICDDCVRSCCCYSCTWCQIAREIRRRGNGSTVTIAQTTMLSSVPMMPQAQGYAPLNEY